MAGRNDAAIAAALEALAQAVQQQPIAGGNDGSRVLETFQRNHPPTFRGKHDLEGAQEKFLVKYYPEDVRGKKEIEYLELKQGEISVTEYAAKFVELENYYPHYTKETAEFSKCVKFENRLRSEIKKAISYQRICKFPDLVNCCKIYEEDSKAH
ncbi:uncharacterized protein LOC131640031 [Vicia villosa]|uniref:uncharacterized protein LOC131640031 n=1 Tax=Vicia villosa TaxID=3911 RepID=UPI00273C829B|nr:uncharacterized protein LOC131640031 [Vicia villosa]